jgi:hypothetical protein
MGNIELQRQHDGKMRMVVGDRLAMGALVMGIQNIDGIGLTAIIWVPLKEATLSEADNILPLVRKAA